ncbi:hypothetical protein [Enterococcus gilvus]|uniref:hypothetical protein n=1 Tax=Enterococcus gilvus TaxID=160453 RepID=UPI00345E2FE4
MRLRPKDLSTVYLKQRLIGQDDEGNFQEGFSTDSTELQMNVQSAGGQVMASVYGQSLPYIKSCKYQGDQIKEVQNEKDGICLYVSKDTEPDYEIVAIQTFSTHCNVTLKKLGDEDGR